MASATFAFKIAIIGLVHSHVWGHLGTMLKGEHARLVGIAEDQPELLAEARARGAGQVPVYSDYRALLDGAKPDIVWAFVENNRHLEIARACAERKVHLMFEKPLAASFADALEIRRLAQQHGIQVLCNYQMAWWPSQYVAKGLASTGKLGRVWRLRGIVGHGGPGSSGVHRYFFDWLTDPVRNGGGALMDFGCYNVLWALWYLGMPQSVYAQVNQLRPDVFPNVEDNATLVLSYPDGVALCEGSWDLPRGFQELEVFGLGGSLVVRSTGVELRQGKEPPTNVPVDPLPAAFAEPIAYLVHCLQTGQPVWGLTALDINVQVNEIIEGARRSAQTGQVVRLPL